MDNIKKISNKNVVLVLLHFTLLIILAVYGFISWENPDIIYRWSAAITCIAIILLIIQIATFRLLKIEITDFRIWFIILTFIFMFGRIFLNAFHLDNGIFWDLMNRHSPLILYHTSIYILCCIQSIFFGFILFEKPKQKTEPIEISSEKINKLMYSTGIILLLFSAPFRLFTDITWIMEAQAVGSYSAVTSSTGLADDFAFLVVPSIIFIIASGKLQPKTSLKILIAIIGYFVVVMILTGDRRYPMTAILALVLCYFKIFDMKFKVRQIIVWVAGAFLILNLLAVLRDVRHSDLTSLGNFFTAYGKDILGKSTLTETLSEFGLTFFSVVHIFEYVPSFIPFQYGFSFIASIPSLLPIGWLFGDLFSQASLSGQINPMAGAPVGASLLGDLYGNFGWFTIPIAIIAGLFISKIFKINNKGSSRMEIAKYYSLFYILINLVRASFFEVFRPSMMVYFIPLFIMLLIRSYTQKNAVRIN